MSASLQARQGLRVKDGMRDKPLVVMDMSSRGAGGGPFTSARRIMDSGLKEKYDFATILYKPELGPNVSLARIRDLVSQLRRLEPDIVHFGGLQLSGFHLAVACRLAGIRNTLLTIHGFSGDALDVNLIKRALMTGLFEPVTLLLTKRFYGVSRYVIARRLARLFRGKCAGAIYNFPPEPYVPDGAPGIREELALGPGDTLVVTVGRVVQDKGYAVLDEVILHLRNLPQLKFLIVGDGDYLPAMREKLHEQAASGQVHFLGYRSDVQRILQECDIFVLPTLHETLSIALLEASVAGLALIASDTGGVPEIVIDGHNGLLVPPGDVDTLSRAICRISEDAAFRQACGENARARVASQFSAESVERQIDTVYTAMLKRDSTS